VNGHIQQLTVDHNIVHKC